jgi:2-polyprenyl-3-methyl-5-hydroxy-6-metoxy-1,4-benzoquinol methylase
MPSFAGWALFTKPGTTYYANRIDFIDTVIKDKKLKVLDVGAGGLSGNIPEEHRPMSRYLYQYLGDQNYSGLEHDPVKAEVMRMKYGVRNIHVGDIMNYKGEHSFDVVYCGLVLPYVYDLNLAFCNIKAHLRPGGVFVMDFPNFMYYRSIARYVYKSMSRLDCDKFHWHHETIDSLAKKIEFSGFKISERIT